MSRPDADRGALLGEGLFETILLVDGAARHLDAHLDRMDASARALGLPSPDQDARVLVATAADAGWRDLGRPRRAVLRVMLTAGTGRGLAPPAPPDARITTRVSPLADEADCGPLRLVTVRAHRVDPGAAISGHKVLSWMPWTLARREASERGADAALVTTTDGDLCECDHANVFAVIDGVVVTPGRDRGVLPGITRARAIDVLRASGRDVLERAITLAELRGASEAWLTSSLDGVRPVGWVDGVDLAAPGPVTTWLADCVDRV